jgi:hypothetical protein
MRLFLTILLGAATLCPASTIFTVSFTPDTLTGDPGGPTIEFSGALLNNTGNTVFINGDSFTFGIGGAVDDSPFLFNAPISLGPSGSSGTFTFLDVTIPLGQAAGTYDGVLTVLGGADGSAQDSLGSAAFHVVVNSTVPEPSSFLLAAAGIASLLAWRRSRHSMQ